LFVKSGFLVLALASAIPLSGSGVSVVIPHEVAILEWNRRDWLRCGNRTPKLRNQGGDKLHSVT
jgi:hypothetical protein